MSAANLSFNKGICAFSICPMRLKPDESSEMVSQLLFGEQVEIIESYDEWKFVESELDGYKGWVDTKLLEPIESFFDNIEDLHYCIDPYASIWSGDDSKVITFGAILPYYDGISLRINDTKYTFQGSAAKRSELQLTESILEKLCSKYQNAPYLWGGKTPFGVDCSGLVQVIYRVLGVRLPRDAKDQSQFGMDVDFASEAMAGDLAFFTKASNRISHVGIILDDKRIIHASGHVRIDLIDHLGIF